MICEKCHTEMTKVGNIASDWIEREMSFRVKTLYQCPLCKEVKMKTELNPV